MKEKGTLTFFCGKMGAGKSTKSRVLALEKNAVIISEDAWLSSLYPNQITSFEDYIKHSGQLKSLVKAHVQNILVIGVHVVMDFPANTKLQRQWFLEVASEINVEHELIYLDLSDEDCIQQIAHRRTNQPERAGFDTEEMFHRVTKFFEEPCEDEGLTIKRV